MRKVEKVCGPPWSTSATAVIHGGWMPRMRKVEKVCGPPWSTSATAVIHGGWMSLYIRDC